MIPSTAVPSVDEYRELARTRTREQFVVLHPQPFLVGVPHLHRPHSPGRTILMSSAERAVMAGRQRRQSGDASLVVLAVQKIQSSFPSMITVGRTANNDVVIEDVQISKFHAFFKILPHGAELADAGSRNGTFVRERKLEPKGPALPVRVGDSVRFGTLEFSFLDASSTWDRLR